MVSQLNIDPPEVLLMGPGPSNPHPRVMEALSKPVVGHLDPYFQDLMDQTMTNLRAVFRTENLHTIPMSATGSSALETIMVNLLEPGDDVVVGVIGYFGERLAEMGRRVGARVREVRVPWGEVLDPDQVRATLGEQPARLLAVVHAETSTGACQPLEELGRLAREHDVLFAVDCVTSLAGMPVEVDDWHVDAAASCSQKCIGAPPGLGPVSFSPRAMERVRTRRTPPQSWYFDLQLLFQYWGEGPGSKDRVFHHTAPVSSIYAFAQAVELILEEGLEPRWKRHREAHEYFAERIEALGLELFTPEGHRLPMLNCISVPEGVDDGSLRKAMRDRGVELSGGFGPLKGKVWRAGLMGVNADRPRISRAVDALEESLRSCGYKGG